MDIVLTLVSSNSQLVKIDNKILQFGGKEQE